MEQVTITGTSPAAASTAVVGTDAFGLGGYPFVRIDAHLVGATGGTLDVYLQRKVAPNVWIDWCHFAQLAAGASAVKYSILADSGLSTTITTATGGNDAAPGVALAAATFVGGHPGDAIRCVCVAGAGTSAGAVVNIYVNALGK
jgi:hypothetical protein